MDKRLVAASLTFPDDLLAEIDQRAKAMDLNRSQYLRHLARKDLAETRDRQIEAARVAHETEHKAAA